MAKFESVTPNLLVRDVAKSLAFYRDILGFTIGETVPDKEPFVFVWMKHGDVSVFLNDINAAAHDYPAAASLPQGGTAALFFIITDVDGYHAKVAPKTKVIMPLKTQFYGLREFAVTDPDGHIITFAERVAGA
ncbi:MAG TPA: glyoxalase superfamily protein [Vicinamibacterales bacterium]|nr:glyoxalase superfamily protein [Vicinamibacterales bacterium]